LIGREKHKIQEKVLAYLTSGHSISKASTLAGCSRRSVHRWLNTPEFYERLEVLRERQIDTAVEDLTAALPKATATLVKLLDQTQNPGIQLQACKLILQMTLDARQEAIPADAMPQQQESATMGRSGLIADLVQRGFFAQISSDFPEASTLVAVYASSTDKAAMDQAEFGLLRLLRRALDKKPDLELPERAAPAMQLPTLPPALATEPGSISLPPSPPPGEGAGAGGADN
jgi:hypothetical protein